MQYKKCTLAEAKRIVESYDNLNDIAFQDLINHWEKYDVQEGTFDPSYNDFRAELVECFKSARSECNGKMSYLLDLRVGLKLYELLNPRKGFTNVLANDDDIWRYISVIVMPDITYLRYPKPEQGAIRINRKRFYSHTRRIWLKSLWWYIHLSWQGSSEKTFDVLKGNAVDNINKLIETPGRGYRLQLFRAMMAEYAKTGPHTGKEFAAFTKMNNAKCLTIEPELATGGETGYSSVLFQELKQKGHADNVN